jgi:hypothetical protein
MITDCKLSKDDESPEVDHTMHRTMISSLLYVTASRIDVMKVVGLVARFQSTPKESHVIAVKRILRYLTGTMDFGI